MSGWSTSGSPPATKVLSAPNMFPPKLPWRDVMPVHHWHNKLASSGKKWWNNDTTNFWLMSSAVPVFSCFLWNGVGNLYWKAGCFFLKYEPCEYSTNSGRHMLAAIICYPTYGRLVVEPNEPPHPEKIIWIHQQSKKYPLVNWHGCWEWPFMVHLPNKNADVP
jgi:hypothetical protein